MALFFWVILPIQDVCSVRLSVSLGCWRFCLRIGFAYLSISRYVDDGSRITIQYGEWTVVQVLLFHRLDAV